MAATSPSRKSVFYDNASNWVVENHGVDPDVLIEDQPQELQAGHDAQLEAAITVMLRQTNSHEVHIPNVPASIPAYPSQGVVPPAYVKP